MTPTLMHDTWATTLTPGGGYTSPLRVDIYYSGAWHDISTDVNEFDGVQITRGRANEGSTADPSRLTLSLRNTTGTYSPRNPSSTLYGLIGRNTPIRVLVYIGGAWYQRFMGEVVAWPQTWGLKGSTQSFAPIEAAGITRRLSQGASPLHSPIYRSCSTLGSQLIAYWPMEDGGQATTFSAAYPTSGASAMTIKGTPDLAAYDDLLGSESLPTLESALLTAVPPITTATTESCVRWVWRVAAGLADNTVLLRIYYTGGTLLYLDIKYGTGGHIKLDAYNTSEVSVGSFDDAYAIDGLKMRLGVELIQSGANINAKLATLEPGAGFALVSATHSLTSVTVGRVAKVIVNPNKTALADVMFGHLTIEDDVITIFDVSASTLAGYAGEEAAARIDRLCDENGIELDLYAETDSQLMGVQGTTDLMSLLRECEATDGGMLYEPRDGSLALGYRTSETLYSQDGEDRIDVAYVDNMLLPFQPTEDDQALRNKVTVTREDGASSTAEQATGNLGTDTVGTYDEAVSMSLYTDAAAVQQAGWALHLGTFDEARWPRIGFDMADPRITADPSLVADLLNIDVGTRLEVTDLPAWVPPFDVSQLVLGYTESIAASNYKIVLNCAPARPYRAAFYGEAADRYSAVGTVLNGAIASTSATSVPVTPPTGISWTHADGDFDILVNGEQMTVTAVSGNTFTVTRHVNGVQKTHATGSAVELADPCYYGL